jgi:hypothetical protein
MILTKLDWGYYMSINCCSKINFSLTNHSLAACLHFSKHSQDTNVVATAHSFSNGIDSETGIDLQQERPTLVYEQGQKRWGTVIFTWKGMRMSLPWDTETGYIYNGDPLLLIRIKNFLLVPRILVDTTARAAYHTLKAGINLLKLPLALLERKGWHQVKKITGSIHETIRSIWFGFLGACAALYGIVKPLEGRCVFGKLERSLNHQQDKVNIFKKHYSAPCFTPLNLQHPHDQEKTAAALKKLMLKYEYLQSHRLIETWRARCKTLNGSLRAIKKNAIIF